MLYLKYEHFFQDFRHLMCGSEFDTKLCPFGKKLYKTVKTNSDFDIVKCLGSERKSNIREPN